MTTTIRFVIGFCEVRLRFRQLSLCVQLGDLKGRFIDREQKIPRVNQLVVFLYSAQQYVPTPVG